MFHSWCHLVFTVLLDLDVDDFDGRVDCCYRPVQTLRYVHARITILAAYAFAGIISYYFVRVVEEVRLGVRTT